MRDVDFWEIVGALLLLIVVGALVGWGCWYGVYDARHPCTRWVQPSGYQAAQCAERAP